MKKEKTFFTLVFSIVAVMVLFIAVLTATFRYMGLQSAESKANLAAHIVQESLTSHMITGSSDYQNDLVKQIETLEGMKGVWIVRSDALSRQYGKGIHPQEAADDIDRAVLRDGKAIKNVSGTLFSDTLYRLSIPYIATENGKIDCLSCHDAKVGTVLGAVSIEMEINDLKITGLIAAATAIIVLVILTIYLLKMIRHYISSYKETLDEVAVTMEKAEGGDYSHRVEQSESSDGYKAAMWTNAVMEKLDTTLSESGRKMASLIRLDQQNSDPLYTLQMGVDQLYEVERFRAEIEKDQNLEEVYARIVALLRTRWNLSNFNILELNPLNKITQVVHTEKTLLCDAISGCRADRTSGMVDSSGCEIACPKMIDPEAHYVCQSYSIVDDLDIVVSLVTYEAREIGKIRLALEQLGNYINASKLQIINKKLQQTVRIDPLTQLYNRAYLEEMTKLIMAQSTRTMIPYGILMIDMDQFNLINHSYDITVGDEVIKSMAHNILEHIRQGDMLIRYGGDTFAVILYDYEGEEVLQVAEAIRLSFKKKIRVNTYAILKTVSIGVSLFPAQTSNMLEGVEFAKRALLEAKHQGGNSSLMYDPKSMPV
ncbi:diguanylate cyclase [Sulfuricurvum kujiense DSM 16994]|uniref:diguanylate cyclase n=1 Tax=Sulfuricurvum kujiense (strain ATCC BAA-921 / DSM 16994 / JCM 11577 / YK-1) TaxID=709032 RepID=E4U0U8_SULKY|nr:GGDEF domain-containing protein [Sulfuricurvum kujiense]ADR33324.1 diguanylate cyclase [Sulfuricurvum kujiense DSM 16994]